MSPLSDLADAFGAKTAQLAAENATLTALAAARLRRISEFEMAWDSLVQRQAASEKNARGLQQEVIDLEQLRANLTAENRELKLENSLVQQLRAEAAAAVEKAKLFEALYLARMGGESKSIFESGSTPSDSIPGDSMISKSKKKKDFRSQPSQTEDQALLRLDKYVQTGDIWSANSILPREYFGGPLFLSHHLRRLWMRRPPLRQGYST